MRALLRALLQKIFRRKARTVALRSSPPRPEAVQAHVHYKDDSVGNDASARPWELGASIVAGLTAQSARASTQQYSPPTTAMSSDFRPDVPTQASTGLLRGSKTGLEPSDAPAYKQSHEPQA